MYELWLLSLYYRIIKAILHFISRHWLFFVAFALLGLLCGIAVGSFFLLLYAYLNHRNEPDGFPITASIGIVLMILGFWVLTSDFYKEFPLLYKVTTWGNAAGLFMTTLYINRLISYHTGITRPSRKRLWTGNSLAIAAALLLTFNAFTHVSAYLFANDDTFPQLQQEETRNQYRSDYEYVKAHNYKISKHDYYTHDARQRAYLRRYNNGQDGGEDTLIILKFTRQFQLTYYAFDEDGDYEDVTQKTLLVDFDATYNNGVLQYNHDSLFDNMDTFHFQQQQYEGHTIYNQTDIILEVIPQSLDAYIQWRKTGLIIAGEYDMNVSLEYLHSKGIPVEITPYPKPE